MFILKKIWFFLDVSKTPTWQLPIWYRKYKTCHVQGTSCQPHLFRDEKLLESCQVFALRVRDELVAPTVIFIMSAVIIPVSRGFRIHWLHLCKEVRHPIHNECLGYDTKQYDGEAPVKLELWGMWSTPSLPSLSGPLWPGVVTPDRVLSMGQIKLFDI